MVLASDTVLLFSEMMRWEHVVRGKRSENIRSSNLLHTAVLAAVLLVVTPYGEGREGVEVEEGTVGHMFRWKVTGWRMVRRVVDNFFHWMKISLVLFWKILLTSM